MTAAELAALADRCDAIPIDPERERNCREPYTWDDGVPYCDTCGLYRSTRHAERVADDLRAIRNRRRRALAARNTPEAT